MNQQADDLDRRLRAADPVPSGHSDLPSGRSLDSLLEETMATPTDEQQTTRGTRWRVIAAEAAVAAAVAGGSVYLATRDDGGGAKHAKSVLALKVPGARPGRPVGPGNTCIRFTTDILAEKQIAFSGTVTALAADSVTLTVDHWYKGGTADEVDLATPGGDDAVLREIAVHFEQGHRYLVSASDGVVAGCGYTVEYSAELAADFASAFGS